MKFFFFIFLLSLSAQAQNQIIKLSKDGKRAHLSLDPRQKHIEGDVIRFFENNKLVSKGTLTYVSPQKTKGTVKLTHGALLKNNFISYNLSDQLRKVSQKSKSVASIKPSSVNRQPSSLGAVNKVSQQKEYSAKRSTQDLLYYPEAKSFLLGLAGGYVYDSVKVESYHENKTTDLSLNTALYYSPYENFSIGLGLMYHNKKTEDGTDSHTASGIGDPDFSFGYRFLSYENDALQMVLNFVFSPSIGKSDENNVLRGNHSIELELQIGKKHGAFSWSVAPELTYYTQTKYDRDTLDLDPFFSIGIDGELQYDLTSRWALSAPLFVTYYAEQKASNDSFKISSYYSLGSGFGFKFAPSETFNIFSYAIYSLSPSVTVETSAPSTHKGEQDGFGILLGMNQRF